ncbi:MAG: PAS domain S-box protein [Candidatus Hermodarchaeota archaeon]
MTSTINEINKINAIISDNIDDPIFILDENFTCEYVNFYDFKEQKNIIDFIYPKDSENTIKFIKDSFKLGKGISQSRIKSIGEQFRWYEIKARKFIEEDKNKLILLCNDITKYKFFEEEFKKSQTRYSELADTLPEIKYWKLIQSKEGINAVQKSREMLELVINNIPHLIYWKDKDLIFLGCNSNFTEFNSLEKSVSIIGRTGRDLNWPKDVAEYIDECERSVIINNKPDLNIVESLITPSGNQAWFEINRIPLHDLKDNVVGILVTYEDITERKTAEQKIKESEEKYRGILENIKETYFEVDLDGTFTFFNDSFIDLMGYQREEIMGVNFQNFVDEENRNKIIEAYSEVFETEKPRSTFKFQFYNKNGNSVICESSVYLRYDSNGKKVGFSGIARDITEQYLLEQKFKESEKRYHHLFESSPYAILLMDENGIIIECNSTINNLLSVLKIEDIIGKKFTDVLKYLQRPEDIISALTDRFNKFLKGDKSGPLEVQITRLDGKRIWLSILSSLVQIGDRTLTQAIIQDITDLKESEEELKKLNEELEQIILERTKELRESEEKFRHLYENSPYGIILLNSRGTIVDINATTPLMFGYNKEDLIGKNYLDLIGIYPYDTKTVLRKLPDLLLQREDLNTKVIPNLVKIFKKDGTIVWVQSEISTIKLGDEQIIQLIVQDVTEKKIAEERIRESERQYRTTIDSIGDPLHVVDKDLRIILINREFENWLDQLNISKDVVGKKVLDVFPFLSPKVSEEYNNVFEREITLITTENTILADHEIITETRKIPIFHEGKVEQIITIIRDITESKEMEDQLKKSEEKYRNMVNNLDVGFYKGEYQGKLLMYNQAAKRILGLTKEDSLIGVKSSQMFRNAETYKRYYKELEERGFVSNFIAQVEKKNGDIITLSINAHVIYDSEGLPIEIEGTFIDITEKFILEQELLESERKLREQNIELMKLDQIKNDFITMAAHELKTPLISISGYTDYILMKHKNQLTPAVIDDLRTVQRNVKRLELLMDQLLEVMKIDEDQLKLHKEQVNVSKLINDCLDELSYLINEKNLEIILNINHEIILNVDATRTFAVFTNLISNAIKFTPEYGWIEITANKNDEGYTFEVKDNGIGLTQEEIGRLFKKFERIKQPINNNRITIKDSGTGLGLYITKGIINAHGGKIYATSDGIDKGSSFIFTLPS